MSVLYYRLTLSGMQIASFLRRVILPSVECLSTIAFIGGTVFFKTINEMCVLDF